MAYIYKPKRKYNNQTNRVKRQEVYNTPLWKRMRMAKLMEFPLCEVCLMEGKSTLGEDVHHLISFVGVSDPVQRDKLAFDSNNLLTVCKYHHSQIHNGYLKGCTTLEGIKNRIDELNDTTQKSL